MYKEMLVWQKAYQFALDVYQGTKDFPKDELFGLTSQMRRAAASIPANLAEGSMRNSPREYLQFIHVARGSMAEREVWLQMASDLGYLKPEIGKMLAQQCDEVGRLLHGLLTAIKKR